MSGVLGGLMADCTGNGEKLGRALMEELKVEDVKALETVPYDALAAAYNKVKPALEKAGEYVGGAPYKNGFYAGDPVVNGFRRETEHVPMMVGSVFGEFGSFAPTPYKKAEMTPEAGAAYVEAEVGKEESKELLDLFRKAYPERNPVDIMTMDFMFRGPEIEYIKTRAALPVQPGHELRRRQDALALRGHPLFLPQHGACPLHPGAGRHGAGGEADIRLRHGLCQDRQSPESGSAQLARFHPSMRTRSLTGDDV